MTQRGRRGWRLWGVRGEGGDARETDSKSDNGEVAASKGDGTRVAVNEGGGGEGQAGRGVGLRVSLRRAAVGHTGRWMWARPSFVCEAQCGGQAQGTRFWVADPACACAHLVV